MTWLKHDVGRILPKRFTSLNLILMYTSNKYTDQTTQMSSAVSVIVITYTENIKICFPVITASEKRSLQEQFLMYKWARIWQKGPSGILSVFV